MNSTNESIHIRKIVLIFVFFICVFMVSYNFSEKEEPIKKIGNGYHDLVGSTSHARISILGDGALAAFPNKTGSGSALDPFVIENLEICGSNTGECIFISGISLYYLVIKNCTVWGSSPTFPASGIHLLDSRNVKIINCTSRFNGIGITIEGSRNNEITGCSISNNAYDGIWVMWDMSFHSDYNLIADNQIFNNTRYGIMDYWNAYNRFTNNTIIMNGETGISFHSTSGDMVFNNTIGGNKDGIRLHATSGENFTRNIIRNNMQKGIYFYDLSTGCIVSRNNISSNHDGIFGMGMCSNIHIEYNQVCNNTQGIVLSSGTGFMVSRNDVYGNTQYGIMATGSTSGNNIYYNAFRGNGIGQGFCNSTSTNNWDDGLNGNYWSDYTTWYPGAPNNGKVWKTAYQVRPSATAFDYYPLMQAFVLQTNDHQPQLTLPSVTPATGDQFTNFTFQVRYTDIDDNPPVYVRIYLGGTYRDMAKTNPADRDYTDGCDFQYSTILQPGSYTYQFRCADHDYVVNTGVQSGPIVSKTNIYAPELRNANLSPRNGDNSTYFEFNIWYYDADNNLPSFIDVVINSTRYAMAQVNSSDTNVMDGKQYRVKPRLPYGTYQYRYECSDGSFTNTTVWYQNLIVNPFFGSAAGFIKLNEICRALAYDKIELYNYGPDKVMTGWSVRIYGQNVLRRTYNFTTGWTFYSNYVLQLLENTGSSSDKTIYTGMTFWDMTGSVAVGIFDNHGACIDWFQTFDYSGSKPVDAVWIQDVNLTLSNYYAHRFNDEDTNRASDWDTTYGSSFGTLNPGQIGRVSTIVALESPVNATWFLNGLITFSWKSVVLCFCPINYTIQISDSPGFSSISLEITDIPEQAGTTSIEIPVDLPTGGYYWRVCPKYQQYEGNWSSIRRFDLTNNMCQPALTNASSMPKAGTPDTVFTFSVVYTDADNNIPITIAVRVNGTEFPMEKQDIADNDFTDGCIFTTAMYFQPGMYEYYFICDDGKFINTTITYADIVVSPSNLFSPTLVNGNVSPTTGENNTTIFTFSVVYFDEDNNAPEFVHLLINGTSYPMTKAVPLDTNYMDGSTFTTSLRLAAGTDRYHFECTDGTFYNSSQLFTGLLVNPPPPVEEHFQYYEPGSSIDGLGTWTSENTGASTSTVIERGNGYYWLDLYDGDAASIARACWLLPGSSTSKGELSFQVEFSSIDTTIYFVLSDGPLTGITGSDGQMILAICRGSWQITGTHDGGQFSYFHWIWGDGVANHTYKVTMAFDMSRGCHLLIDNGIGYNDYNCMFSENPVSFDRFYIITSSMDGGYHVLIDDLDVSWRPNDHAPELIDHVVNPLSGNSTTMFNFSVVYQDADNNCPQSIELLVNGLAFPLSKENASDVDYRDGCVYHVTTYLQPGHNNYTFQCNDGVHSTGIGPFSLDVVNDTNAHAPVLSAPTVSPKESDIPGLFNFTVIYQDGDNNAPVSVEILLNGTSYEMVPVNPIDTNYMDGATFYFNISLGVGYYRYKISCSDGVYSQDTGWFDSPEVNPFLMYYKSGIVINEVSAQSTAYIEFYNHGIAQDMTGWTVRIYRYRVLIKTFTFPSGWMFNSRTVVVLNELTGTNTSTNLYIGWDIPWSYSMTIAAGIFDDTGANVDWFQACENWGILPADAIWIEDKDLRMSYGSAVFYKSTDLDNDRASNWVLASTGTKGNLNPGQAGCPLPLYLPVNGSTLDAGLITFSWRSMVCRIGAINYSLQIASDPAFSSVIQLVAGVHEMPGTTSTSVLLEVPAGRYYWRVIPEYQGFHGEWSETFVLDLAVVTNTPPELDDLSISPEHGFPGTRFTFNVTYTDADNDTPLFVNITINGTSYAMVKQDALDDEYAGGCQFVFTIALNATGNYSWWIDASDPAASCGIGPFVVRVDEIPRTPPVILNLTQPEEYVQGSTGNYISFVVVDGGSQSGSFIVTGAIHASGTWINGTVVAVNVDGLLPGVSAIVIQALDGDAMQANRTLQINVTILHVPSQPTAFFGCDLPAIVTVPILFHDLSSDADGAIVAWQWNFGDGTENSTVQDPRHAYDMPGHFTVTLTVLDDDGLIHTYHSVVVVEPMSSPSGTYARASLVLACACLGIAGALLVVKIKAKKRQKARNVPLYL